MWGPNDFYAAATVVAAVFLTLAFTKQDVKDKTMLWLVATILALYGYGIFLEGN